MLLPIVAAAHVPGPRPGVVPNIRLRLRIVTNIRLWLRIVVVRSVLRLGVIVRPAAVVDLAPAVRRRDGADRPDHCAERCERHGGAAAAPLALRAELVGARVLLYDRGAALSGRGRAHVETRQRDRSRGGEDQRSFGSHLGSPRLRLAGRKQATPAAGKSLSITCISMTKFH
jgi:hypothetical protein